MRIVYLTLAVFILLNVGAACRTPSVPASDCARVAGGLVHCSPSGQLSDD